jgi:hypothetical protein
MFLRKITESLEEQAVPVHRCNETNVMFFSFIFGGGGEIEGLYVFRALLDHLQEVLHKWHLE